jgi:hypothetical protein
MVSPKRTPRPERDEPYRRTKAWAKPGEIALTDVTPIAALPGEPEQPFQLSDLSPDNALISFLRFDDPQLRAEIGTLEVATGRETMRFALGPRSIDRKDGAKGGRGHGAYINLKTGLPLFSPDGDRLLFQDGHFLRVLDLGTHTSQIAARTSNRYGIGYQWLADGRIAYVGKNRRLMVRRVGRHPEYTGVTFYKPKGYDDLLEHWSVDPQGKKVLYWKVCETTLLDLESGDEKLLSNVLSASIDSWSPSGKRFFLRSGDTPSTYRGWQNTCPEIEDDTPLFGYNDVLFSREGRRLIPADHSVFGERLSSNHGHSLTWSDDEHWLLAAHQPSGTCVTAFKSLYAAHLDSRIRDPLLRHRMMGDPLAGRDGLIVFARYNSMLESICTDGDASNDDSSGTLYTARISMP